MKVLVDFVRSDWQTLGGDLVLGLIALAFLVFSSPTLAIWLFCVLSYLAGITIIVVLATLIGIVIKEKISAWFERHR